MCPSSSLLSRAQIRKISRHRMVPKAVEKARKLKHTVKEAKVAPRPTLASPLVVARSIRMSLANAPRDTSPFPCTVGEGQEKTETHVRGHYHYAICIQTCRPFPAKRHVRIRKERATHAHTSAARKVRSRLFPSSRRRSDGSKTRRPRAMYMLHTSTSTYTYS